MSRSDAPALKAITIALSFVCAAYFTASPAYAVSAYVKSACKSDYFRHCSQHAVGSEGLRQCMRKVGEDLSTPCLVALVKAGEVTKQDIEKYKAKQSKGAGPVAGAAKAETAQEPARAAQPAKAPRKSNKRQAQSKRDMAKPAAAKRRAARRKSVAKPSKAAAASKAAPGPRKPARTIAKKKAPHAVERPAPPASNSRAPQVAGWASQRDGNGAAPAYTHNLCRATTLAGEIETFTCGLDEKCCYGALFNEKFCVPLSKSCF